MQWMRTGTVSRIATRPDQRCTVAVHAGADARNIRVPVTTWTMANTTANVVSQAFAYSGEENPAMSRENPLGWCTLAYTPIARATAQPPSSAMMSGLAYLSRVGPTAVSGGMVVIGRAPPAHGDGSWAHDGVVTGDRRGLEAGAAVGEGESGEVERRRGAVGIPGHGHPGLRPVGQHRPADPGRQPVDQDPGLEHPGRVRGQLRGEREAVSRLRRDRAEHGQARQRSGQGGP